MKQVCFAFVSLMLVVAVGCSDDTEAPPASDGPLADQSTNDLQSGDDLGSGDDAAIDAAQPDGPPADQGIADQGPGDDATTSTLTSAHSGWQKTNCSSCHSLPVAGHTTSDIGDCASCHGANGACDVPGSHSQSMTCISSGCHGNKHGFTDKADCVSCHFAAAGTVACP